MVSPKQKTRTKKISERNADTKNLELKLEHALGTRVRVKHGKKRGKIEIEYYSLEDLDRVLKLLGVKAD